MLDACMIEDGGGRWSRGSARIFIDQYLEGNTLLAPSGLIGPNKLKPHDPKRSELPINAGDLQSFINKTTSKISRSQQW